MRAEKQAISEEYLGRVKNSPFFIVVDYTGLKVGPMTDLRKRLAAAEAEIHIVKNSIFRIAVKESGLADPGAAVSGQSAVVTGRRDAARAAKLLKSFHAEFEKPKIKFGYLGDQRMDAAAILVLADLPPLEELRAKLAGLLQTPATRLVQMIQTPASQLARVLNARVQKG